MDVVLLAANMTGSTNATAAVAEFLASALSNPSTAVAVLIQFLLGFAAGYYMAKIARYIVALVGVFIIGALIGVWGTAGSVEDALKRLGATAAETKDAIMTIVKALGLILVGPTALGFFVGIVVGFVRR